MQFTPKAPKDAVKIRFIDGDLSYFTGKELKIGKGKDNALTQGSPKASPLTRRKFVLFMRKVIALAKQNKVKKINVDFKDIKKLAPESWDDNEIGKVTACSSVMANYEHNTYKTKPKDGWNFVDVVAVPNTPVPAREGGFWVGEQIAAGVNECRELANTPGGDMTPKDLADAAKKMIKGTKASVKVLGRADMESLGMGAILGMAKGSAQEPQFIIAEYWGAGRHQVSTDKGRGHLVSTKPLVLIGKGVTFDTGGLNIKTGDHMYEMHMDMSGGAAVISAVALAARMKLKVNVIALVPAVENAASGTSVRPGDVLKSLSGKTIEVLNTDAEGRVILADAITYAKEFSPSMIVDVATLTGAALVALGQQASAYMTNDEHLIDMVQGLGEKSGDYMWPLPAWDEYEEMTKGTFGDIPNISAAGNSRYGGVIAGGMFLKRFADDLKCPWIHIDMAPRMTATSSEFLAKGAAGAPVRFLYALIEKHASDGKNGSI